MKKILSLVISGIVASSLMVGCSNKETAKETVIIKYQNENGNTIKEKEVTKEEAQEIKEQNKSKEIKKEVNNKSEVKKESKTYQQSNKNYQQSKKNKENTTKKDNSDNKTDETNTDKSKKTTKGYWVTCPKGHKIWTINGDWNCNKCEEEYEKEQEKEQEKEEPEEHSVEYVKCPNCGNPIYVNEYFNGTCNGCGLNYFPGCTKKGTELDKVEHEEENQSDDIVEENQSDDIVEEQN